MPRIPNAVALAVLGAALFSTNAAAQSPSQASPAAKPAQATPLSVFDPWVRATVPQQKSAGAYMRLQSAVGARLVGVSSPLAGRVEIHEMAMENNTMRMRQVDGIDLPAGMPVSLATNGYHLMFVDLKRQLKEGEQVPLTLVVQTGEKKRGSVTVEARVRPLTYVAPQAAQDNAGHGGPAGQAGHAGHAGH